jgi:hypothetical protein
MFGPAGLEFVPDIFLPKTERPAMMIGNEEPVGARRRGGFGTLVHNSDGELERKRFFLFFSL